MHGVVASCHLRRTITQQHRATAHGFTASVQDWENSTWHAQTSATIHVLFSHHPLLVPAMPGILTTNSCISPSICLVEVGCYR